MSERQDAAGTHVIDIFMMSVKCGNCGRYQTIVGFDKSHPERNVYTYECDFDASPECDVNVTRTIVEVPKHLDNSTKRAEELPYYSEEAEGPGVSDGR
jgi:hypothetical protein